VGSTAQTKERHDTEQAFFLFSMLKGAKSLLNYIIAQSKLVSKDHEHTVTRPPKIPPSTIS
jgi:hypothetical protein